MRLLLRLFFGLSILATMPAMAAVFATLKNDVTVSAAKVRVGDVIEITGDDAINKALTATALGNAPLPGYSNRYSRKEIERVVHSSGINQVINWRGADAVRVERKAKFYDSDLLVTAAETYVRNILNSENNKYQIDIELAERLPELLLSDGNVEIKPRHMTMMDALHSRVTVWLDISVAGVFSRSIRVPLKVKVLADTLIAKRDLAKGISPTCDDLVTREADIASMDGLASAADCNLLKGNLKKAIAAGTVLTKNFIQAPIAISHGDNISLLLNAGAFVLESRATALADGEIGQRIQVKPTAATDTIIAVVVAPGVAKVIGN
ncbi:flagellar basal body P-ring formation chaperone FlgA [Undibacterium sp. TJN19]|uniref:flagellar basal body P-ring formation chaperone FlgA n=1 Tax=Undibacterium sp. TJN19 TaxID=3413055 RepID=UPI003BEFAC04